MQEDTIAARVWLRERFPGFPDRLLCPDVTTLTELSEILMIPVSAELLLDREFRKKYAVTLVSEDKDSKGAIVCEMDVIAVGNSYREENYYGLRYGWHGNRFSLQRAGETIIWDRTIAQNCKRIASYYENPDAYFRLFNTHWSL